MAERTLAPARPPFLPWHGEWALLGPWLQARLPCLLPAGCSETLGLGFLTASLGRSGKGCPEL